MHDPLGKDAEPLPKRAPFAARDRRPRTEV